MPPKNSKSNKTSIRKKNSPKIEEKVSPMKTRSKPPIVVPENNKEDEPVPSTSACFEPTWSSSTKKKTPQKGNNKDVEPVPSTSAFSESTCSSSAEKKSSKYDSYVVTPKIIKSRLNAYKLSPDYENLKKKRFNTSFRFERPRGDRDIEIFTPEEEEQFRKENPIKHDFHYGDKTANVFMSIPEINIDDVEEEIAAIKAKEALSKNKIKRGRKKSIGYKGVPFEDGLSMTEINTQLMLSP